MLLSGRSSEIGSIRERVGIRSQVSTQSPVARHNHIGIIGLRSFSIPTCQMKFQLSSATGCAGSYRKETMGSLSYDPR